MKLFRALRSLKKIGDSLIETRTLTQKDVEKFSQLTFDKNTVHKEGIINGAFLNGIVAGLIGSNIEGALVVSQSFSFPSKCLVDSPITVQLELVDIRKIMKVKYKCEQNNILVFEGEARLIMNKSN